MAANYILFSTLAIYLFTCASAYDPRPMQDICVADFTTAFGTTGIRPFPCKNPSQVKAEDFFSSALRAAGNTTNPPYRAGLIPVSVLNIPGLNTMDFTMARADLEAGGFFPLHYHQRASEVVLVTFGCVEVGFVTSAETNYTLFTKKLSTGDVFVIPMGLIHYWRSCFNGNSTAYAILDSQNPGVSSVTHSVFGSKTPTKTPMSSDYLQKTYQLNQKIIEVLQRKNWAENL